MDWKTMIPAAALCLAACVTTPDQLRQLDRTVTIASARTPMQAASCVARNVERIFTEDVGNIREVLGQAGTLELIVRNTGDFAVTSLVAEFTPTASGSEIKLWTRHGAGSPWIPDATKGC